MQPTYLPWSGYFNLIRSVDTFVFLDDVQFERRSWQMRNRILLEGQEKMLSVSTIKAPRETLLRDIELTDVDRWRTSHAQQIRHAYRSLPGWPAVSRLLDVYLELPELLLADFNVAIIETICELLAITTRFERASELDCGGRRGGHLGEIATKLGADVYLSPVGSREYLAEDGFSDRFDLDLEFQSYVPRPYPQPSAPDFVSHLSVVDVIAHLGPEGAAEYIE